MNLPMKALSLSVIAAVAVIGCGKKEEAPAPQPAAPAPAPVTIIKIGHVGPLTGGIAHLGKDNENGARMAIDEANAGNPMVGGQKVKGYNDGEWNRYLDAAGYPATSILPSSYKNPAPSPAVAVKPKEEPKPAEKAAPVETPAPPPPPPGPTPTNPAGITF